jgi:hypothetical protein
MKMIIAGGRDYIITEYHKSRIAELIKKHNVSEIVSGGARGADAEGEKIARELSIPIKVFPAQWDKHGKAAGPIRNKQMAVYGDILVILPGGSGTNNMRNQAKGEKLMVYRLFNELDSVNKEQQ